MTIAIESPLSESDLVQFIRFQDTLRPELAARWPASIEMQLPILSGIGALAVGREIRPFTALENGELQARALAFYDPGYFQRWGEKLAHLAFFEARPGARAAVRKMIDSACEWLAGFGARAVRAGYYPAFDSPFVIDEYDTLPPAPLRQNPDYYHSFIKDAGFECEKGMADYRIEVTSALIARYQSALEAGRRAGFEVVPLKDIPRERRVKEFAPTFNDAFRNHWGFVPAPHGAFGEMFMALEHVGALETSLVGYLGSDAVGALLVAPDNSAHAVIQPGRLLSDSERLNVLAIGVREPARGRGFGMAMAAYAYLKLIEGGAKYLSYTLVLDDNWPSRRTAEKLGAKVRANYMIYRRNFS